MMLMAASSSYRFVALPQRLLILCTLLLFTPSNSETDRFCGESVSQASLNCAVACPTGLGCPAGQFCFSGIDSCPTSKMKSFGHEAVEETFKSIKTIINTKLFLYETPDMQWLPSTVYDFDGFFDGLQLMYKQGVNGKKMYMGGNDPDCPHCHMYGIVNIAAFLAQAMKETIRYDACDENSWDRVGDLKMYPISNACGQLGQSYQDYYCKEEERFMECPVDPSMSIKAVTNARWWGAPGPLFCGPKTQYPHTGYWDFSFECNNQWANPPIYCDDYEGQKGGKHIDNAPYANAAGRIDVEGCCWWGRGVIQTSGVCNFGKLNYFLGKRAHDEGRESRYPDIDFCKDPEAICANENYKELKWIAGFFYWVDQVQPYENEGWNYLNELQKFVDGGMQGDAFINAVSGIVNRGCHNPPCGTGVLDGGPERAENFFKILKEMTFSWVDVNPIPIPTPPPIMKPTPSPTSGKTQEPTDPPYPAQTPRPISPPTSSTPTSEPPFYQTPVNPISPTTSNTEDDSESLFIEYICGNGAESGLLQTYIDVIFAYEIHNKLDTAAIDALKEGKQLMLADIARSLGCYESRIRNMQQSDDDFSNIIGISSVKVDGLDLDVAGCTVEVQVDAQTSCTPVKGGFTLFVKSGTDQDTMKDLSDRVKSIIEKSMTFGEYETGSILKAVYIGDRVQTTPDSINTYSEPEPSKDVSQYALYALIVACLVLLCLLCMALRSMRRRTRKQLRKEDEELAFDQYMESYNRPNRPAPLDFTDEPQHIVNGQNAMFPAQGREAYMRSQSHSSRNSSRRSIHLDDSTMSGNRRISRGSSRGSSKESRRKLDPSLSSRAPNREGSSINFSQASTKNGSRDPEAPFFRPPPPRSKSTPFINKQSGRRKPPPAKMKDIQAEDDSSDEINSSSSESQDIPPPTYTRRATGATSTSATSNDYFHDSQPMSRANTGATSNYFHDSQSNTLGRASSGRISVSNDDGDDESAFALAKKDERRQRLEAAKARASSRRSARTLT